MQPTPRLATGGTLLPETLSKCDKATTAVIDDVEALIETPLEEHHAVDAGPVLCGKDVDSSAATNTPEAKQIEVAEATRGEEISNSYQPAIVDLDLLESAIDSDIGTTQYCR